MGCIVSSVACCFCSSAASLCCVFLPSCKNSTSTRIMFSLILVATIVLSTIALIPSVRDGLRKIPALCTPYDMGGVLKNAVYSGLDCSLITGFGAVYRLCFASSMFFFAFSILMIRVRTSADPRAKIQNGLWFFKVLIWIALVVAAFFIPVEGFTETWMVFGMIGGVVYIIIQQILLIDFAFLWNEGWMGAYEETNDKCYAFGLIFFTLLFYIASLVGIGLLYHFYAGVAQCGTNIAMLTLNVISCAIFSLISVLPAIRKRISSGLLQSSLISFYIIFLTYSALSNTTDPVCNPTLVTVQSTNSTTNETVQLHFSWQNVFGVLILIFCLIYSSIKTSSHTSIGRLTFSNGEKTTLPSSDHREKGKAGQTVWDDEEDQVAYGYSMFHLMLFLASLYAMVMVTNWFKPEDDFRSLGPNMVSYWVRMISSWACMLLYLWVLIAPALFPDRNFA